MTTNPIDDPVEGWVRQPIPEKLWHYTSIQGFQGIVASGSIYATDVRFLNDTEEFIHCRKVAEQLAAEMPEVGEYFFPMRENVTWLVTEIFKSEFFDPDNAQIFVASFSDSADDLSQWRAYSHGTYGVSIAFDLRWIRPPKESGTAVTFAPCIYRDEEKKKFIQYALQASLKVVQSTWREAVEGYLKEYVPNGHKPSLEETTKFMCVYFESREWKDALRAALREAMKRMLRLSGLLKHKAFHHEREWRLFLPISPGKDKSNLIHPIRFRSTVASQIPYIATPLPPFSMVQAVNDVILGPGASAEDVESVRQFLNAHSIKISARRSDVPYRQP